MSWINTPESSNIARFKYDNENMVLTVEFNKGGQYNYFDVPESTFASMRIASSKGQYLARNIKGRYRYARV